MKKVNLCVVGTGRAGLVHARNIARRIARGRLAALCDANPQSLREAGREMGVDTLVGDYRQAVTRDDVDAVVVATPTFLHHDIACLAARSGKHVFLEKPMAVTVQECHEINQAVAQAGVKLQLGFMRRFDERFRQAKEVLESGQLGRIMIVKSTGRGPGGPGPWMYDLRKSNGIVAEVNSHDLDSLRWFIGSEVRRVYAEAANFKSPEAREKFPDFYDNIVAQFRFVDGTMGVVDGTCPAHYGYDARVEILCEKGALFVGRTEQAGIAKVTADGQLAAPAIRSWRNLFKDAYLAEMEHFVECILRDQPPRITGTDGLKALEMVVAANESIRLGRPVELPGS